MLASSSIVEVFGTPGLAESLAVVCLPPALTGTTFLVWRWLLMDARVHERARANRRARMRLKSMVASLSRGFRVGS